MSDQTPGPPAQQETSTGMRAPASVPSPAAAFTPASVPSPAAVHAPVDDAAPAAPAPDAPPLCTQAQLRRFIKSRPYVPLHELRRRFGLNGADDDVGGVDVDGHRIFIGLPERETALLGELLRQGDVGYELLLDPTSPVVVGVFPMRPVQRP
jgi:hypothetical protein